MIFDLSNLLELRHFVRPKVADSYKTTHFYFNSLEKSIFARFDDIFVRVGFGVKNNDPSLPEGFWVPKTSLMQFLENDPYASVRFEKMNTAVFQIGTAKKIEVPIIVDSGGTDYETLFDLPDDAEEVSLDVIRWYDQISKSVKKRGRVFSGLKYILRPKSWIVFSGAYIYHNSAPLYDVKKEISLDSTFLEKISNYLQVLEKKNKDSSALGRIYATGNRNIFMNNSVSVVQVVREETAPSDKSIAAIMDTTNSMCVTANRDAFLGAVVYLIGFSGVDMSEGTKIITLETTFKGLKCYRDSLWSAKVTRIVPAMSDKLFKIRLDGYALEAILKGYYPGSLVNMYFKEEPHIPVVFSSPQLPGVVQVLATIR